MIKKLLTFLFLIFFISVIFAQNSTNFPSSGGKWKSVRTSCWVDYQTFEKSYSREYKEIVSAGDTIFNDTLYFKLLENEIYNGALRQDSCKVFYRFPETNHEILLYDFCVTDKFYSPVFEKEFTVTKIDSVIIGGAKRKIIFFDDDPGYFTGEFWIEGIGSSGGLLKPSYYPTIPTCDLCCGIRHSLVCYSIDTDLLYLDENYFNCDSVLTSQKDYYIDENLKIYPNPSEGIFFIELANTRAIKYIEIFSIQGELLIQKLSPDKSKIHFYIETSGIYFARINKNNRIMVKKIIIN